MNATPRRFRAGNAALAAAALVLAACGSQEAPDDATPAAPGSTDTSTVPTEDPATTTSEDPGSTTSEGTATAPADDATVELGVEMVGDLTLPAAPDEALEVLVPLLGEPTADSEADGCAGEEPGVMRMLVWGDFGLYGQAADAGSVELTSWEVVGDTYPPNLVLPEGLEIGAPETEVLAALPGAEVIGPEGVPHGGKLVRDGDLTVKLSMDENSVSAVQANIQLVSCD